VEMDPRGFDNEQQVTEGLVFNRRGSKFGPRCSGPAPESDVNLASDCNCNTEALVLICFKKVV
jgi:hypothetical protein